MTMQRPRGPPGSGQGLGESHIPQPRPGGGGGFGIGCKYFAYCLIKHKQTSDEKMFDIIPKEVKLNRYNTHLIE